MIFPYGETVTLHTRTGSTKDGHNNEVPTFADVSLSNVAVADRASAEAVQGQDTVTQGLVAYLPPGVTVQATDRVTVRGLLYDVDGQPFSPVSPFTGWAPGTPVNLVRSSG